MTDPTQLPPAAMLLRYQVADFDAWKAVFDANESNRKENGFLGHHINRSEENSSDLSVYFAVGDTDAVKAYASSDGVRELMSKAGVVSDPEFAWMKPRREEVVWDRQLPAMLIRHQVADFEAWLTGYDGADELRRSYGIVGHAANQAVDDPSLAVIYHQAESFDDLRAFAGADELRIVMKEAGVTSEPEFSYHTGGWGKQY